MKKTSKRTSRASFVQLFVIILIIIKKHHKIKNKEGGINQQSKYPYVTIRNNFKKTLKKNYLSVRSMIKANKIYTCTPNVYSIKKGSTSAVTTAFTRTSTCEYQKGMGTKKKNDSSTRAWYITYQVCTTISKKYERVTEADTYKIRKLYAWKTEIKERGLFLLGELNSPFMWVLQKSYTINMMMLHKINIWNKTKANKIDRSSRAYNCTTSCL